MARMDLTTVTLLRRLTEGKGAETPRRQLLRLCSPGCPSLLPRLVQRGRRMMRELYPAGVLATVPPIHYHPRHPSVLLQWLATVQSSSKKHAGPKESLRLTWHAIPPRP